MADKGAKACLFHACGNVCVCVYIQTQTTKPVGFASSSTSLHSLWNKEKECKAWVWVFKSKTNWWEKGWIRFVFWEKTASFFFFYFCKLLLLQTARLLNEASLVCLVTNWSKEGREQQARLVNRSNNRRERSWNRRERKLCLSLLKLEHKLGSSHEPEPASSPRRVDLLSKQIGCCPRLQKQVSSSSSLVSAQSLRKIFETRKCTCLHEKINESLFCRYMEMSMAPQ